MRDEHDGQGGRQSVEVTLSDGGHLLLRPIAPTDAPELVAGVEALSPRSRYRRFFTDLRTLSPAMARQLTELDYDDNFAWVAIDLDGAVPAGVGVARYSRLRDDREAAEVAVAVADDHHRRGVATVLLELLALTAAEHGIRRLVATVLPDNGPVQDLLRTLGAHVRFDPGSGLLEVSSPVPTEPGEIRHSALYAVLRLAAQGGAEAVDPSAGSPGGSPG